MHEQLGGLMRLVWTNKFHKNFLVFIVIITMNSRSKIDENFYPLPPHMVHFLRIIRWAWSFHYSNRQKNVLAALAKIIEGKNFWATNGYEQATRTLCIMETLNF